MIPAAPEWRLWWGIGLCSQVILIGQQVMASSFIRGGSGWELGKKYSERGGALAEAAQGVVGSPTLGVFKDCRDMAVKDAFSGCGRMGWAW